MMRKIYLEGEMGQKFVPEFEAEVSSVKDAIRLIEANFPELKSYLVSCHEKNVGFNIEVAGEPIDKEEDLLVYLNPGDITISPIPAGSKSGGAKILAAIAIIVLTAGAGAVLASGGFAALGGGLGALQAGLAYAATTWWGLGLISLGLNLAIAGIQQLMAPDPSVDDNGPQSYLFNGSEQNVIEGDPVPILYGELRVPGRPIAFSIVSNTRTFGSTINLGSGVDSQGNLGASRLQ